MEFESVPSYPLRTLEEVNAYLCKFFEDPESASDFYVPILSCVLSQITSRNDELPLNSQHVTIFHALKPPAITIRAYLDRLVKYANCSPECFVIALIYLDRLIHRNPGFIISTLNVHRLIVTSVMIAAKFFDDVYYNNGYYARVGGVSNKEMNALELEFLYLLNFQLSVSTSDFARYQQELYTHSTCVHESMCHCRNEATVCGLGNQLLLAQQQQQQQQYQFQNVVDELNCGVCVASPDAIGNAIIRSGSADSCDSTSSMESVVCDDVIYHEQSFETAVAGAASSSSSSSAPVTPSSMTSPFAVDHSMMYAKPLPAYYHHHADSGYANMPVD